MTSGGQEGSGPASRSRRVLIAGAAGLTIGAIGGVVASSVGRSRVDPSARLPDATFEAGDAGAIVDRVAVSGPVMFPRESPRVAVTTWDPGAAADGQRAWDHYGEPGERHPVLGKTGLLALRLTSTHLGCRVPYCESSGWFEDPCHGSKWNSWGEYVGGPAPRGLDRYRSVIRDDGRLVVDLAALIVGPPREPRFNRGEPTGPHCVDT